MDTLSEALHVLAGEACMHVGEQAVCAPFNPLGAPTRPCDTDLCTWLCADAHFFTLFQSSGHTLLYSHTNEIMYHASSQAQLPSSCPKEAAFLCQFTFDSLPEGRVPRLLAFDVMCVGPANVRGDVLRGMQQHLPQPLCCAQWIGFPQCLSPDFLASLPHATQGLIVLQEDSSHPLLLRRE